MDDLLLRARFDDNLDVWISDVSRDTFEANELDDLGTDFGYFLMVGERGRGGTGAKILAKAASEQAAIQLFGLLTSAAKRCAVVSDQHSQEQSASITQLRT